MKEEKEGKKKLKEYRLNSNIFNKVVVFPLERYGDICIV